MGEQGKDALLLAVAQEARACAVAEAALHTARAERLSQEIVLTNLQEQLATLNETATGEGTGGDCGRCKQFETLMIREMQMQREHGSAMESVLAEEEEIAKQGFGGARYGKCANCEALEVRIAESNIRLQAVQTESENPTAPTCDICGRKRSGKEQRSLMMAAAGRQPTHHGTGIDEAEQEVESVRGEVLFAMITGSVAVERLKLLEGYLGRRVPWATIEAVAPAVTIEDLEGLARNDIFQRGEEDTTYEVQVIETITDRQHRPPDLLERLRGVTSLQRDYALKDSSFDIKDRSPSGKAAPPPPWRSPYTALPRPQGPPPTLLQQRAQVVLSAMQQSQLEGSVRRELRELRPSSSRAIGGEGREGYRDPVLRNGPVSAARRSARRGQEAWEGPEPFKFG